MNPKYDNSGILFKNTNYERDLVELKQMFPDKPNITAADYKGNATINGQEYFMDAYLKKGENGTFMSFRFKPKSPKAEYRGKDSTPRRSYDDAPF